MTITFLIIECNNVILACPWLTPHFCKTRNFDD